jgi:calcyclin binding protein
LGVFEGRVYVMLDGIGDVPKENIKCDFGKESFDLRVHGYKGKNLRLSIPKLNGTIFAEKSRCLPKQKSIILALAKDEKKTWDALVYKESKVNFSPKNKRLACF